MASARLGVIWLERFQDRANFGTFMAPVPLLDVPFAQHLLVEFADAALGQSLHEDDSLRGA